MVRSFCVEPILAREISHIPQRLDEMLITLQSTGWNILSVTPISFRLWDYPDVYAATKFVILAEVKEETDDGRIIIIPNG